MEIFEDEDHRPHQFLGRFVCHRALKPIFFCFLSRGKKFALCPWCLAIVGRRNDG